MFRKHHTALMLRATAVSAVFVLVTTTFAHAASASALTWKKLKPAQGLPARASFASKQFLVFDGAVFNSDKIFGDIWKLTGK